MNKIVFWQFITKGTVILWTTGCWRRKYTVMDQDHGGILCTIHTRFRWRPAAVDCVIDCANHQTRARTLYNLEFCSVVSRYFRRLWRCDAIYHEWSLFVLAKRKRQTRFDDRFVPNLSTSLTLGYQKNSTVTSIRFLVCCHQYHPTGL